MNGLTLGITGGGSKKTKNTFGFPTVTVPESNHVLLAAKNKEVQQFLQATSVDQQLTNLKNILSCIGTSQDQDLIKFLVVVFLQAEVKHPVKCFLTRSVTKSDNLEQPFAAALSEEILRLSEPGASYRCYVDVVGKMASCVENFPAGAAAVKNIDMPLAQYLSSGLECTVRTLSETQCLSPTEKNEVFNLAHSILRLILYITQKVSPDHIDKLNSMLLEIRPCLKSLLFDDDVPMDTKSVCGIVYVSMYILQNDPDSWVNILNPENNDETLQSFLCREASRLSLYAAIVTAVPVGRLHARTVGAAPAVILLAELVIGVGERTCSDSSFNLAVARTLVQISRGLDRAPGPLGLGLLQVLLPYVWGHLDHHMDSVRHLAAQTLGCIVRHSARLEEEGDSSALDGLFSSLHALDRRRKSYYVSVAALAGALGPALLQRLPRLLRDLMDHLAEQAVQASATMALETLLNKQSSVPAGVTYERWVVPIIERAARAQDSPELAILEGLLTKVVMHDQRVMDYILPYIEQERDIAINNGHDLKCVLMLLSVCRKTGVVGTDGGASWAELVGGGLLETAAVSASEQTRLLSLALVVESPRSTEVFPPQDLSLVLHFLRYNCNARAPSFRQRVLALVKKFLKRLEDSYKVLTRRDGERAGAYYVIFLDDLRAQCVASLLPGASYGRRHVALQTLAWAETTCLAGHNKEWKEEYVEKLLLHLEDSYENNKALALEILQHCPERLLRDKKYSTSLDIEDIFRQASSVKPTDCTSAAYKLSLLQDKLPERILEGYESSQQHPQPVQYCLLRRLLSALQAELAVCDVSVLQAARAAPMYGLLHCMLRVVDTMPTESISHNEAWSALVAEVISTCVAVTAAVAPVVNNASPEGHLPMDMGGVEVTDHGNSGNVRLADGRPVTAQMVLLCAWRSVKEVSLLLGSLCSRLEISAQPPGVLTHGQVLAVGEHFTTLLAETKHRGAFEQAYVGFTRLLARLWRCREPELHELPRRWLCELLAAVERPGRRGRLCATRRSAGLPFMIQALVTTELQVRDNPSCFHSCVDTLLRLAARGEASGEASGEERNSSTLLFSALVSRVFGAARARGPPCARARMTGRVFFLRYPHLYDLLLSKVSEAGEGGGAPGLRPALYPVLLLLGRLYPSALEGTVSNLKLAAFVPGVLACARGGDLRARRLAAAAAPPLIAPHLYVSHLESLLELLSNEKIERNYCHGILLQITRLLDVAEGLRAGAGGEGAGLRDAVRRSLWALRQRCYVVADEYIKMISLMLWKLDTLLDREIIDHVVDSLNILLFESTGSFQIAGRALCLANAAYLYFIILNLYDSSDLCRIVYKCLSHACYEVVLSALNYILIMHEELELEDHFQEHLARVANKGDLEVLNTPTYLELLCDIVRNNKYLECNQKALKVLMLSGDTERDIIRAKEGSDLEITDDVVMEKLIHYIENEHENLIPIYLQSLTNFLAKILRSASVDGSKVLEAIRVIYACSSSDNSDETRKVVVDFLDANIELLFALDLKDLKDEDKFEYQATVHSTLATLLEDEEPSLSQGSSDLIWRAVGCRVGCSGASAARGAATLRARTAARADGLPLLATLALLDFQGEVLITDEGNDECRVFDTNERYNMNLEESVWTRACADHIKQISNRTGDALLQHVRDVIAQPVYRHALEKLCGNNYAVFSGMQTDDNVACNPKVQLFIDDLRNVSESVL